MIIKSNNNVEWIFFIILIEIVILLVSSWTKNNRDMSDFTIVIVWVSNINTQINQKILRNIVVDIVINLFNILVYEFNVNSSLLFFLRVSKIDEMPFQVFFIVINVLVQIGNTVSL